MQLDKTNYMELKEVINGVIVKTSYLDNKTEDGQNIYSEQVELIESEISQDLIRRTCELVAEWLGHGYDRYGNENLNITFDKKGHKYVEENEVKEDEG